MVDVGVGSRSLAKCLNKGVCSSSAIVFSESVH